MTTDNASANDTLINRLGKLENSFDVDNHVRCFNHTLQLSAKALIQPFNPGMANDKSTDHLDDDSESVLILEEDDDKDINDADDADDANADGNEDGLSDDIDDNINEMEALSEADQEVLLADTAVIRDAVSKVCLAFLTSK